MGIERPLTGAERVAKRRATLRANGLKPRTFWLPDTKTPAFKARARRSCAWLWDRAVEDEQSLAFAEAMTDEILSGLERSAGQR